MSAKELHTLVDHYLFESNITPITSRMPYQSRLSQYERLKRLLYTESLTSDEYDIAIQYGIRKLKI